MAKARRRWLLAGALVALQGGCQKQDTDKLAKLGRNLLDRAESFAGEVRQALPGEWKNLPVALDTLGVEARVAARLRWERGLGELPIRVEASGATVVLHGAVRDEAQRRKAVELAEATAGVEKVEDRLLTPPPRPEP
jgi:osmotically-inducible protein OsmY